MKKWLVPLSVLTVIGCIENAIPAEPMVPVTPAALPPLEATLAMPATGWQQFRVLSPNVLELTLITTKASIQDRVTEWDFIGENFKLQLPASTNISVTVNNRSVAVEGLGFKRRPLYAPLKHRDLRIRNDFYVQLAEAIPDNAVIEVRVKLELGRPRSAPPVVSRL